jgi:hypothetical protein
MFPAAGHNFAVGFELWAIKKGIGSLVTSPLVVQVQDIQL